MITAGSHTELRARFYLEGEEGELYAISSAYDDYLELTLPPDRGLASAVVSDLQRLPAEVDGYPIDVRFVEGERVTVCVLALYVSAPQQRSRPHGERVRAILRRLALEAPSLDFGDLLPQEPTAREGVYGLPAPVAAAGARPRTPPAATGMDCSPPPPTVNGSSPNGRALRRAGAPGAEEEAPGRQGQSGEQLTDAEKLLAAARSLAAQGRLRKARQSVDGILQAIPGHPGAMGLLREMTLLERREKRRRREPGNAQAQLEAGLSYLLLNCDGQAIQPLHQAQRLSPDLYLAHLLLGIAHHRQGETAAARAAYRRAARIRPQETILSELMDALNRGAPPVPIVEDRHDGTIPPSTAPVLPLKASKPS